MNVTVDEALLILKIGFIVLLYLFIWRIVRSASRDFRAAPGGESVIMSPTDAAALGLAPVVRAKLVVLKSPALTPGSPGHRVGESRRQPGCPASRRRKSGRWKSARFRATTPRS